MNIYHEKRLTTALTYSGAIPFIGLAGMSIAGLHPVWAFTAFMAYGAVIASFLAGAVWAQAQLTGLRAVMMLATSNIAALVAFAALIIPAPKGAGLTLQAAAFVSLLVLDWLFAAAGCQPGWYFVLRRNISGLVLASYGAVALLG